MTTSIRCILLLLLLASVSVPASADELEQLASTVPADVNTTIPASSAPSAPSEPSAPCEPPEPSAPNALAAPDASMTASLAPTAFLAAAQNAAPQNVDVEASLINNLDSNDMMAFINTNDSRNGSIDGDGSGNASAPDSDSPIKIHRRRRSNAGGKASSVASGAQPAGVQPAGAQPAAFSNPDANVRWTSSQ